MTWREFTMTDEQLAVLLDACRPVPYVVIGGVKPASPQDNANAAWQRLGAEMGFDWRTVKLAGGDQCRFTAVPTEAVSLLCRGCRRAWWDDEEPACTCEPGDPDYEAWVEVGP